MRKIIFTVAKDVLDLGVKIQTAQLVGVTNTQSTKITLDLENVFLIVQGNPNTENDYVRNGANEVLKLLTRFCGGACFVK